MDPLLLKDLAVILLCGSILILLCHLVKLPTIVGFLLTGLTLSSNGLHLLSNEHTIQTLADVGVILLLFSIGMELPIPHIRTFRKDFFLGGLLQVTLTSLIGLGVGLMLGRSLGEAIFLGWLISLSSTAVVGKILSSRFEIETPQGIMALAICIFQDVITIPMILLTPYLAHPELGLSLSIYVPFRNFAILLGFGGVMFKILPPLFAFALKSFNRELFLILVLSVCFGTTWVAYELGLPVSIGAFLAGLLLANLEYQHQAISDISSLKEIFLGIFFLSLGMMLDLRFLYDHIFLVIAIAAALVVGKSLLAILVGGILGLTFRQSLLGGIILAQIGEFSFILLRTAQQVGIGTDFYYQLFLNVALFTMAGTVILIEQSHFLIDWMAQLPYHQWLFQAAHPLSSPFGSKKGHILVIGFGLCGKQILQGCKEKGIECVLIDRGLARCREAKQEGLLVHLGDATHSHTLEQVNLQKAKLAVVSIHAPSMALHIAEKIRAEHPSLPLFIRCHAPREIITPYNLSQATFFFDQHETANAILSKIIALSSS